MEMLVTAAVKKTRLPFLMVLTFYWEKDMQQTKKGIYHISGDDKWYREKQIRLKGRQNAKMGCGYSGKATPIK